MKPPRSVGHAARRVMTDLLRHQTVRPDRTESEQIAELIRDLAMAWDADRITVADVAQRCTGYERFVAVGMTSKDDPAWGPLMRMLDALIAESDRRHGLMQTKHGVMSTQDVIDSGAKLVGANRVIFPIAWPWRRKPDPERADPGVRDEPVFREPTPIRPLPGDDDLSWFERGDE